MTLSISFKSLDYLTVCITTQFCATHFFDLTRNFHNSGFLPAIRTSIFAILFPLTKSCTGILLQYTVSLHLLPSLPHPHSGAPFAVLTGLLTISSQNLTWVSSIIFHPPFTRHFSPTYNVLHSKIISYTCFNTYPFTPGTPIKHLSVSTKFCLPFSLTLSISSIPPNFLSLPLKRLIPLYSPLWRYTYHHHVFQFSSFSEYNYFSFIKGAFWIPFITIFIRYIPYLYTVDDEWSSNTNRYKSPL